MLKDINKIVFVIGVALITKKLLHHFFDDQQSTVTDIPTEKIFTLAELRASKYDKDGPLLLGILGKVYDVSTGHRYYKPGGSYDFFVGVDGSRAFSTGKFKDDLTDNIDDLSDSQIGDIFSWQESYEKNYKYVGKLEGRFYDTSGKPTEYLFKAQEANDRNKAKQDKQTKFHERYPSCNSEWSQEKGGLVRVWCTTESGGVKRSWIGRPRLLKNPHTQQEQCACVNDDDLNQDMVKKYDNCDEKSRECVFIK